MRPTLWLTLVLLAATASSGCSNPKHAAPVAEEPELEFPEVDLADGGDVKYVAAPEWRPGYHFTYEESGAYDGGSWGAGIDGNSTGKETYAWGPRPGLNYTVVAVDSAFGESRFLALDREPGYQGPRLFAFEPDHLEALGAYVVDSCYAYGKPCTPYLHLYGEKDPAAPVDFPLRDGPASRKTVDQVPFLPLGPVNVLTDVLGMKEVAGPEGPVQAVHIHQSFAVNMTRAAGLQAEAVDRSITGYNLTGTIKGTRDVFYAPSLLNVVLDQTSSVGDYTATFQRDGRPQSYGDAWRRWSSTRLTAATYEERAPMTLAELGALQRSDNDFTSASGRGIELEVSSYEANTALEESVQVNVTTTAGINASQVRILVYDAGGVAVKSLHTTKTTFTPERPGPYLIVALAVDGAGKVVDRRYTSLYAYHDTEATVDCDPVAIDGATGCPTVPLPLGPAIDYVMVIATINNAAVVPMSQGRLFVDPGDGQQITSTTTGSIATIYLDAPAVDPESPDWTAGYQPDPGVAVTVRFQVSIWPGYVPSQVYAEALSDDGPVY